MVEMAKDIEQIGDPKFTSDILDVLHKHFISKWIWQNIPRIMMKSPKTKIINILLQT